MKRAAPTANAASPPPIRRSNRAASKAASAAIQESFKRVRTTSPSASPSASTRSTRASTAAAARKTILAPPTSARSVAVAAAVLPYVMAPALTPAPAMRSAPIAPTADSEARLARARSRKQELEQLREVENKRRKVEEEQRVLREEEASKKKKEEEQRRSKEVEARKKREQEQEARLKKAKEEEERREREKKEEERKKKLEQKQKQFDAQVAGLFEQLGALTAAARPTHHVVAKRQLRVVNELIGKAKAALATADAQLDKDAMQLVVELGELEQQQLQTECYLLEQAHEEAEAKAARAAKAAADEEQAKKAAEAERREKERMDASMIDKECKICFTEEMVDGVGCVHCKNMLGCKGCVDEWVKNTPSCIFCRHRYKNVSREIVSKADMPVKTTPRRSGRFQVRNPNILPPNTPRPNIPN